jgi:hypothetical protein
MTKPLTSNGARAVPFYYPFEAAIAWCELSEDEARTVRLDMQVAPGPLPPDYPDWPCLYERAALIVHALKTGKLPYGLHGKPGYDRLPLESELPWLTVDPEDLKNWIARRFPSEKPAFLFSATERAAQADLDRAAELAEENAALKAERDELHDILERLDEIDPPEPTPPGVTVTLPHMNKALAALFRIMADNWTDFDPRRKPKQTTIAAEIDAAMEWNPSKDGTPSRNAKVLAAIIQPDLSE